MGRGGGNEGGGRWEGEGRWDGGIEGEEEGGGKEGERRGVWRCEIVGKQKSGKEGRKEEG